MIQSIHKCGQSSIPSSGLATKLCVHAFRRVCQIYLFFLKIESAARLQRLLLLFHLCAIHLAVRATDKIPYIVRLLRIFGVPDADFILYGGIICIRLQQIRRINVACRSIQFSAGRCLQSDIASPSDSSSSAFRKSRSRQFFPPYASSSSILLLADMYFVRWFVSESEQTHGLWYDQYRPQAFRALPQNFRFCGKANETWEFENSLSSALYYTRKDLLCQRYSVSKMPTSLYFFERLTRKVGSDRAYRRLLSQKQRMS